MLSRPLCILFLSFLWVNCYSQKLNPEKIHQDFEIFRGALVDGHPGLYWNKSKESFDQIFERVEKSLDTVATSEGLYTLLYPVIDSINCGHSLMLFPQSLVKRAETANSFFPIPVRISNDQIISNDKNENAAIGIGTVITSINGQPSGEILQELYGHCTADKQLYSRKKRIVELLFPYYYAVFIDRPQSFTISTSKGDKEIKSAPWYSGQFSSVKSYISSRNPISFEIDKDNISWLTLRTFAPGVYKRHNIDFSDTLGSIFAMIASSHSTNLVIDLRDNTGGGLGFGPELFSFLTDKKFRYFATNEIKVPVADGNFKYNKYCDETPEQESTSGYKKSDPDTYLIDRTDSTEAKSEIFKGKIILITNGLTFSSAALFTSYCKSNRNNTFIVGDLPGGAYSGCNGGGPVTLTLPNSKLSFTFNLVKLNLNVPNSKTETITPDIFIEDSLNDQLILEGIQKALKL